MDYPGRLLDARIEALEKRVKELEKIVSGDKKITKKESISLEKCGSAIKEQVAEISDGMAEYLAKICLDAAKEQGAKFDYVD